MRAIASEFASGGTDNLENPQIFKTPEVANAGKNSALEQHRPAAQIVAETKLRMFKA